MLSKLPELLAEKCHGVPLLAACGEAEGVREVAAALGLDLLSQMLTYDAVERISPRAALQHEWFRTTALIADGDGVALRGADAAQC